MSMPELTALHYQQALDLARRKYGDGVWQVRTALNYVQEAAGQLAAGTLVYKPEGQDAEQRAVRQRQDIHVQAVMRVLEEAGWEPAGHTEAFKRAEKGEPKSSKFGGGRLRYTKGRVMSCTTGARTTLFYTVEVGGVVPTKSFSTRHDLQEIEKFAQE